MFIYFIREIPREVLKTESDLFRMIDHDPNLAWKIRHLRSNKGAESFNKGHIEIKCILK